MDIIKMLIGKVHVFAALMEHIPERKDQKASTSAYQFVVLAHTHRQGYCLALNVQEIAILRNPQLVVIRTVKRAHLIPSHTNLLHRKKTFADQDVGQDYILRLD